MQRGARAGFAARPPCVRPIETWNRTMTGVLLAKTGPLEDTSRSGGAGFQRGCESVFRFELRLFARADARDPLSLRTPTLTGDHQLGPEAFLASASAPTPRLTVEMSRTSLLKLSNRMILQAGALPRNVLGHLDLGDQSAGRRIPPGELDAGCLADLAASSAAPDEIFRSQRVTVGQLPPQAYVPACLALAGLSGVPEVPQSLALYRSRRHDLDEQPWVPQLC